MRWQTIFWFGSVNAWRSLELPWTALNNLTRLKHKYQRFSSHHSAKVLIYKPDSSMVHFLNSVYSRSMWLMQMPHISVYTTYWFIYLNDFKFFFIILASQKVQFGIQELNYE
jgi:hypothetical protein